MLKKTFRGTLMEDKYRSSTTDKKDPELVQLFTEKLIRTINLFIQLA